MSEWGEGVGGCLGCGREEWRVFWVTYGSEGTATNFMQRYLTKVCVYDEKAIRNEFPYVSPGSSGIIEEEG